MSCMEVIDPTLANKDVESLELDLIGRYRWFGDLLCVRAIKVHGSFYLKG